MECEKSLIDFIKNLLPGCLYNYALSQLVDFDLIELVDIIAGRSHLRIHSMLKILARERDECRLIFREGRNDSLVDRLSALNQRQLVRVNTSKPEFLEFLTSMEVTRVLVKDISLTGEFYGYQHTLIQFRKFSFAALKHLETFRNLVLTTCHTNLGELMDCHKKSIPDNNITSSFNQTFEAPDDNAFEGDEHFRLLSVKQNSDTVEPRIKWTNEQRQMVLNIFDEFLTACLNESTEDSCRLWANFINFYLSFVGSPKDLERDIMALIEERSDCRMAITLFKAIYRDEIQLKTKASPRGAGLRALSKDERTEKTNGHGPRSNEVSYPKSPPYHAPNTTRSKPLVATNGLHNLFDVFENEFLINLLAKTLDLVPMAADLDALSVVAMC